MQIGTMHITISEMKDFYKILLTHWKVIGRICI